MEALQARIKLDRFIRVRTGKASIQLSQFLSKIGKDESWLAGIKKGTTCVEPDTFKPALKYLKIKHGSQEYYEFGYYVYNILDDEEKEEFSTLYSKKDVADMIAKYDKSAKPSTPSDKEEIPTVANDTKKNYSETLPSSVTYGSKSTELFKFMSDKLESVGLTWAELDMLIGTKISDRVRTIGQFSPKYLKDILDALSINHDSDDARHMVELVKASFRFKVKQSEIDTEYSRILEDDKKKAKDEAFAKNIESLPTISSKPIVEEKKTEVVEVKSSITTEEKKPGKSLHQARKDFGRFFSYVMVIKGLTITSLSALTDIPEESITSIVEGNSTFDIFQAMRLPDLINLDSTTTREFKQKYLMTIDGNSKIEFPEYVTKYLNTHPSAVLAIAKAADINADDTYWNNMYNKLISDSQ